MRAALGRCAGVAFMRAPRVALAFIALICALITPAAHALTAPGEPYYAPEALCIDWDARYTLDDIYSQLNALERARPENVRVSSLGYGWAGGEIPLARVSEDISLAPKPGMAVIAGIHGDERESTACAMYFAWWLALNAEDGYVKGILGACDIYVIPVLNPDGYAQSDVYGVRANLRPRDLNGDGAPFSDPYTDLDGDGYIAEIYRGAPDSAPHEFLRRPFGFESPDWDSNGLLGDDPVNGGVDLNRSFDCPFEGENARMRSEPEARIVAEFIENNDIRALASLHTGLQCVLYPWCCRPYSALSDPRGDIPFMKNTARNMARALERATGRAYFASSSYDDYATCGELIDYAYGCLGVRAYTVEVYRAGKSPDPARPLEYWGDSLPAPRYMFYTHAELAAMGVPVGSALDISGAPLDEGEGLWFYVSPFAQMIDRAPERQLIMAMGARDALLVMTEAEIDALNK